LPQEAQDPKKFGKLYPEPILNSIEPAEKVAYDPLNQQKTLENSVSNQSAKMDDE
jgi:hypothetical protein